MFLLSSQFSSYFTFVVLAGGVPNGTDSRGDGVFPGSGGHPMLILERHFYIRCDSWPQNPKTKFTYIIFVFWIEFERNVAGASKRSVEVISIFI